MRAQRASQDFSGLDASMQTPAIASIAFHSFIFILAAVGLPHISKEPIISTPVSVELVQIDEETLSNKVNSPPPSPPKMTADRPPDLTEPTPPKEPEPKPEEPKKDLPEPEAVPEPVKKPEPPKKEQKKEEKKPKPELTKVEEKKPTQDFSSLLKNLAPDVEEKKPTQQQEVSDNPEENAQMARLGDQLTMSEQDAVKRQLGKCWNVMSGAKNAEDIAVEVRVIVNPDRTVQNATIVDMGRYNSDTHFRAAADSALRALRNPLCSPLELPPNKYQEWKTTIINFNPSEML